MSDLLGRHGSKLAVGGLVLLNLVLIGTLVLRDPVRTAVPAEPVPASSPSVSSSLTPTSTGSASVTTTSTASSLAPGPKASATQSTTPSPSPTNGQPSEADSRSRLLAANSGRVAWRATATGCNGAAVVEVTTNGGRSWTKTKPGLTAIVRLKAYGNEAVFAIGADDECRPTYAWMTRPKQPWQRDRTQVASVWYRSPDDLHEVHAPSGRMSRPCGGALVSLAGLGTYQAAVLCADGRIRTDAQGRSWKTVQTRSRALSLNADDDLFVAVGTSGDCAGVVVRRFESNGNGLGANGDCRARFKPQAGAIAVSTRYQQVWLWSGTRVSRYLE